MDFGVVLQTDPPAQRRSSSYAGGPRAAGSRHVWTFDSHVLWQEPFVIYSQILAADRAGDRRPDGHEPGTRDWTVTASLFATLNEMYGNRTVCGIGRGDSARRVHGGTRRRRWPTLREAIHVIRELARRPRGRASTGSPLRVPVGADGRQLEVWMAAYGPKALRLAGERRPTASSSSSPTRTSRGGRSAPSATAAATAGPRPRRDHDLRGRARLCRRRRSPTSATSAGGSAAWSATTWPTWSPATAAIRPRCRTALTDYIKGRQGYDYSEHGRAGNPHTDFVPDEIIDRFCLLGPRRRPRRAAARAARRSASTSSPSTSSTTPRRHSRGVRRADHPGGRRLVMWGR